MKHLMAALIVLSLSSCALARTPYFQQRDKRVLNLEKERNRLKSTTDPVSLTKTHIKIAEILITFIGDAARSGDAEVLEHRLSEYLTTIRSAHDTMSKSGRDAKKKSGGFKELEIALRRQANQLEDIGRVLAFDERQPVEKVRQEAITIRDELMKAIFGGTHGTPGD
jgi:hypothetical protein